MKRQPSPIHRLLFSTAKKAHSGSEAWFTRSKLGITPLQFGVLRAIGPEGSTLNELARDMMLKPPSILPTVDLLERLGHVVRRENRNDRRKVSLAVTAKGKRLIERVFAATRTPDPLSIAFRKLSEPKKKKLLSLLSELNDAM